MVAQTAATLSSKRGSDISGPKGLEEEPGLKSKSEPFIDKEEGHFI